MAASRARYKAKYVWKLAGEASNRDEEIEREIGWVEAAVDRTNGQLVLPLIVPPPASLSVAYAVAGRMGAAPDDRGRP